VPPDEVLFRHPLAPARYAECDEYTAHEDAVRAPGTLPDNDLLGAVHAYASRFYGTLNRQLEGEWRARHKKAYPYATAMAMGAGAREHVDERSMDETALLAFGILLEEAGREVLGEQGDLVFAEGVPWGEGGGGQQRGGSGDGGPEEVVEEEDRPRKRARRDAGW
jgi:hypothetical protein